MIKFILVIIICIMFIGCGSVFQKPQQDNIEILWDSRIHFENDHSISVRRIKIDEHEFMIFGAGVSQTAVLLPPRNDSTEIHK